MTWYVDQGSFDALNESGAEWRQQAVAAAAAWNAAWPGVLVEANGASSADGVITGKSDTEFQQEYGWDDYAAVHPFWNGVPVPDCDDPINRIYAMAPQEIWVHLGGQFIWNSSDIFQTSGTWQQSRKNVLMHEFGHLLLLDHTSGQCPLLQPPADDQEVLCSRWTFPVTSPVTVTLLISQPPAVLDAVKCLYP